MAGLGRSVTARGVGELLVIVVGVLVALWIEGWREARIDADSAVGYMERLEADLVADSARLSDRIQSELASIQAAGVALSFAERGWDATLDTVGVLAAYHRAGFVNFFSPQTTTWDDLISTGNLRLLEDPRLREQLGRYHKNVSLNLLSEMDDNRKETIWYRYRPALEFYFPASYLNRTVTNESPYPLPPIDFDGLRDDPAVVSGLKSAAGLADVYQRHLRQIAEENREVLAAVRAAMAG